MLISLTIRRSGCTVVTTASPENFELVKSRGTDAVFDYHDPECARLIKEYTEGELYYVLDCVSTEPSYKLIAEALPETPQKAAKVNIVTLLPLHDGYDEPEADNGSKAAVLRS